MTENTIEEFSFHRARGQCHIYMGPMCSGKTLEINNKLTMAADIKMKVLRIGHVSDIRNTKSIDMENGVTSHNSQFVKISKDVRSIMVSNLSEVDPNGYHVIGIDEGQFFQDLYSNVKRWVMDLGKIVHIASLDADSNLKLFGQVTQLIPIAETVTKKTAMCIFCLQNPSGRIITPAITTVCKVKKTGQTLVGGLESYSPACLKCWSSVSGSDSSTISREMARRGLLSEISKSDAPLVQGLANAGKLGACEEPSGINHQPEVGGTTT